MSEGKILFVIDEIIFLWNFKIKIPSFADYYYDDDDDDYYYGIALKEKKPEFTQMIFK